MVWNEAGMMYRTTLESREAYSAANASLAESAAAYINNPLENLLHPASPQRYHASQDNTD